PLSGTPTIGDFPSADIALGGQGAPLVPYVDYLLWREANLGRVALNIGGIANLTVIPANANPSEVFAFDTGPGNMLIDALVSRFTHNHLLFDEGARIALRGKLVPQLLDQLMHYPYLERKPTNSTARKYFEPPYVEKDSSLGL